jgi:hypothetical protein
VSSIDRARWRAWCGVADLMGLGPVTFEPDPDGGWTARAGRTKGHGDNGADALASLCRKAAARRKT